VKAAKRAGMKCMGFRNANSGDQDLTLADIVIDDLREVNLNTLQLLFVESSVSN
jgi:beta-phosphoglucomutase-like phosphatase (HAD superfamily)